MSEHAHRRSTASPELSLVVRCCRFAFGRGSAPDPTVFAAIDWPQFLKLARFHRVQGLVWRCLSETKTAVPHEVSAMLSADARSIALANLLAAQESKRLLLAFAERGLPILFVKGVTLGQLAYGDASAKAAADIDLLTAGDRLDETARLLLSDGYRLEEPAGPYDPDRLRAWHGPGKESTWRKGTIAIDLHSRLTDNPRLIPAIGLRSRPRTVEVFDAIPLPTLGDDELFAYLSVHGASSAWFRLKWIADLAGWLHQRSAADVVRLYRRSQELGAGRASAQALLLADALFDTLDRNTDLRSRLAADKVARWLCGSALRQFVASREPTEERLGTWRIHLTQFALLPGLAFKASEFGRQARAALR